MQAPRQRNSKLSQVQPNSPYFTHIESSSGSFRAPPPPPPPPPAPRATPSPQQRNSPPAANNGGYAPPSPAYSTNYGSNGYAAYNSGSGGSGSFSKQPQHHQISAPRPSYSSHSAEIVKPAAPVQRRAGRNNSSGGCLSCGTAFVLWFLWTGALCGGAYYWYSQMHLPQLVQEQNHLENQLTALEEANAEWARKERQSTQQWEHKMQKVRTELDQSSDRLQQLQNQLHDHQSKYKSSNNQIRQSERVLKELQRNIQSQSKDLVLQKYGAGPHRVEFEISFPSGELSQHPWYFVVELASVDQMPHTIWTFLEQVDRGMYNNGVFCFHHNGGHVVFGSPMVNHLTPEGHLRDDPSAMMQHFKSTGYGKTLFTEYHPAHPHTPWTLGLGDGRGPNLYINTIDNTQLHGPEGTNDPCFATIVKGLDVVQLIHTQGSEGGTPGMQDWKEMVGGPVAVQSVALLPSVEATEQQ